MRRLAVTLLLLAPLPLAAQGWLVPPGCEPVPCPRPRPCPAPPRCPPPGVAVAAIARTASDVRVALVDRVLRFEVTEKFVNRGAGLGEADYFFPLPRGAAFQELQLSIDGQLVAGEVMDAAEARRVYEEIVRRQRDPALVEWAGAGLLRARVFPIAPGEEKTVVVRFQAVAPREGDALRVDYARGRGPRPGFLAPPRPAPMPVDDAPRRPTAGGGAARASFVLTYPAGEGYGTPYSPTHVLRAAGERRGERRVEVEGAGGDVTILLPVRRAERASVALLAHAPGGTDGYALLTVTPPARPTRVAPRDLTFVLDVSGSMSGTKLAQAKAAGRQLLATLGERDRFRLIDFSTDVREFRDGFVPATAANVAAAGRYLEALEAEGSTNIAGALRSALGERALEGPSGGRVAATGRLSLVLFVTDGEPTVGERDPEALATLAADRRGAARVFTFGLGADVNAALLERVALEGRGTAHFVRPTESVERAVSVVGSRLTAPVATDVTVRAEGEGGEPIRLARSYPSGALDLFAGQDLVLLTRYAGSGTARVVIEGQGPDGPVRWTSEARFPERERANAFVARLWATQRVGWLSAERRAHGPNPELDAELRELGERYGIPTELTSYFVREPDVLARSRPQSRSLQLSEIVVTGSGTAADAADASVSAPAPAASRRVDPHTERFESAKRAAAQRAATTIADSDASDPGVAGGAGQVRRAGARVFSERGGVWVDARYHEGMTVVRVKPYSAAWLRVAELLPDARDALAVSERVIVAGRDVAVEVGPDGAESLSAREEAELARRW